MPFAHMKRLLNLSYNGNVNLEKLKPETDSKLASNRRHTYHGDIGDNISDDSSSGGSSDSDYSGNHSKDDPSNDGSEYKARGPALRAPILQPIKIRLWMNKTQLTPSSDTSPKSLHAKPTVVKSLTKPSARRGRHARAPQKVPTPDIPPENPAAPDSSQLSEASAEVTVIQQASAKPTKKCGRPRKKKHYAAKINSTPLTNADWERIAARLAANFTSHWNAENERYQRLNPNGGRALQIENSATPQEVAASQKAIAIQKAAATKRAAAATLAAAKHQAIRNSVAAKTAVAPRKDLAKRMGMRRSARTRRV
ncbi:hypothetical protein PTTG_03853 [Puccinia triticina 1-1 BBBD Race 1]|uniref:Uncharacterized protein n=1 Tax=Puccinia triticina (isolate 1-1 / race 1 (BBBD)) TaxID=630390 RepID=A0A180GRD8_PUCT1|nr:hypothetical protein PTTG_03853 [Puccinia triticina 1-1 BBBD Race 1]